MFNTRTAATAGAVSLLMIGVAACGDDAGGAKGSSAAGYPVTVQNCGSSVKFTSEPKRAVLLKSAAVPYLHDLGVLDRVTAKAGAYPDAYYDAATRTELKRIPLMTDKLDAGGHLQISKEAVLAQDPDLVLGEVENLSRETLSSVEVPLLEEPALCAAGEDHRPSFGSIYAQLDLYGKVFHRPAQATKAAKALRSRVSAVHRKVADAPKRTAAVLYPTVGGGVTYAYGSGSMADPQLRAAGFTNVFGNVHKRVFEVSPEKLLDLDPDVLILLYSDGDPAKVKQAVRDLAGAKQLKAVRSGNLMPQLFNFTEPPSPLSVTGLEKIVQRFPS